MSANAGTPGRKKRENNFHEPGVRGRKTGLVLKDTGLRDKDGLELIEGIFSSPEKSVARNSRKNDATLTDSEDMEEAQSSAPGPVDVLSGRKLARESLAGRPPPHGRSPIKTNIGATPRRQSSVGVESSPQRRTPAPRASSHPAINRLLDFSMTESRISVASSGGRSARTLSRNTAKDDNDMYDIPEDQDAEAPTIPGGADEDADADMNNDLDDENGQINGIDDYSPAPMMMDDDMISDAEPEPLPEEIIQETSQILQDDNSDSLPVKKRGRGRPSLASQASVGDTSMTAAASAPKQRGRPPKNRLEPVTEPEIEVEERQRKRTRLSLLQEAAEQESAPAVDEDPQPEDEPEASKGKKGKGTKKPKPPPSKKDPNAKITSTSAKSAKKAREDDLRDIGVIRGRQIMREETPMEDEGALHTQSGRLSYRPLDYWKGERPIYKVAKMEGVQKDVPMNTVQGLIRVEEITPRKKPASGSHPRTRKKRKLTVFQGDEQDQDYEEPWELEQGLITGPVRIWDPELGQGVDDEGAEQEIAFAASHIEPRDVPEQSFRFAKTLTMPFFGSGIVELPPGGFKHRKSTRRMQMVFFVHYGKVTVEVGGTRFVITKGGMWQVPRGNFYSLSNETDQDAKIFFSQGCEMAPEPADQFDPGVTA